MPSGPIRVLLAVFIHVWMRPVTLRWCTHVAASTRYVIINPFCRAPGAQRPRRRDKLRPPKF